MHPPIQLKLYRVNRCLYLYLTLLTIDAVVKLFDVILDKSFISDGNNSPHIWSRSPETLCQNLWCYLIFFITITGTTPQFLL